MFRLWKRWVRGLWIGVASGVAAMGAVSGSVSGSAVRQVDRLLARDYPSTGPGAAVLVTRGDRVLLRKGYGLADLQTGERMTPDRQFRIASISKQFTAVAVLQLAAEGRLRLDDRVARYLPDFFAGTDAAMRSVTVRELLDHTSGLKNYSDVDRFRDEPTRTMSAEYLWSLVRGYGVQFTPGTEWSYCNTGYMLLGVIVERVSGLSFGDYLETRVLGPAGLKHTRYFVGDPGAQVVGYSPVIGSQGTRFEPAPVLNMSQANAAGGLVSCVDDLWTWEKMVDAARVLDPKWVSLAQTAVTLAPATLAKANGSAAPFGDGAEAGANHAPYGFGWELGEAAGCPTVGHGGTMCGYRGYEVQVPAMGIFIAILTNCDRPVNDPADVAADIVNLLARSK